MCILWRLKWPWTAPSVFGRRVNVDWICKYSGEIFECRFFGDTNLCIVRVPSKNCMDWNAQIDFCHPKMKMKADIFNFISFSTTLKENIWYDMCDIFTSVAFFYWRIHILYQNCRHCHGKVIIRVSGSCSLSAQ